MRMVLQMKTETSLIYWHFLSESLSPNFHPFQLFGSCTCPLHHRNTAKAIFLAALCCGKMSSRENNRQDAYLKQLRTMQRI